MPAPTPIACVLLAPWSLTLLSRRHPSVPVAVLGEATRRIVAATPDALTAGVQVGMGEIAALSRCPELHAEVVTGPTARAAWDDLLETLYTRYSDRVEGQTPGVVSLKLRAPAARELAAALHAPVGLAQSVQVAHLAARRAPPGEVREVTAEAERDFLPLTLVEHLDALGVTAVHAERLHFLGVRRLADLMRWSASQREAFLGVDVGKQLNRFLRGERTTSVTRHVPDQVLEAQLTFNAPLREPGEAETALSDLIPGLLGELRGRTCAYLTLHADTVGGRLSATRKLKGPLNSVGVRQVAGLALTDTGALPLGVDALTVQLSGLAQPARMVGLWPGLGELQVTRDVLDRFPEALVRVQWQDPFAYVADAQYVWVDWQTGQERPLPLSPRRLESLTRTQAREQAIQRVLACFEDTSL